MTANSTNDIIEMQYSEGCCFSGYKKTELKINENNITVISLNKNGEIENSHVIPIKEWKKYSAKICKITKNWASKYIDIKISDGYQWSLDFLLRNGEKKDYYGSNSFPDKWNDFKKILTKIEQRL